MTTNKPLLMIIDGNSFVHRSFHALPPFKNRAGHPTGAIAGSLNMINSLMKKYSPDKLIVCFDAKGKTFRHDIYPDYKGTRPPSDPDLSVQFEPLKKVVKAWGLPMLCIDGVEADDTIGTLAVQGESEGYYVVISTSDKDIRQLVNDNINIIDTKDNESKEPYGVDGVISRMGVPPSQVIDLLAMTGDKADNIPGVNKVGSDTAGKWLAAYGSLDSIIANAHEFKGKRGEYLREAVAHLPLSYKLVTIKKDVPLPSTIDELKGYRNEKDLFELATTYELNQFKRNLDIRDPDAVQVDSDIVICQTDASVAILNNKLSKPETQTLYVDASNTTDDAICIAINNPDKFYFTSLNRISDVLGHRYANKNFPRLIGNNVKDVVVKLIASGALPAFPKLSIKDSRLLYYVQLGGRSKLPTMLDINNNYAQMSLSPLRQEFKLDDKAAKWAKLTQQEWASVKSEELLLAHKVAMPLLAEEVSILSETELGILADEEQLLPILATAEAKGILIDKACLEELDTEFAEKTSLIERKIKDEVGVEDINLSSPKQIGNLLYNVMGIPTKTPTTKESVLTKLAKDYPVVRDILSHRSLSKIRSTYINGLLTRLDDESYIHPKFNQGLTLTGRLSAEDPNVQSIPVRNEDASRIRSAFIAMDRYRVLALDYSQIELRILAHMAQDKNLMNAFNSNKDVHRITASEVLGVDYDAVTDKQRRFAKAINFGLIYGKGAKALAEETGYTLSEAKQFIASYFLHYNKVKGFMESQLLFAKENGYVMTDTGRKIYTPDVNASNPMMRSHAELSAKNSPIQGTAADIIKQAMLDMFGGSIEMNIGDSVAFEIDNESVILKMQVHDELVFYVAEDVADTVAPKIAHIMENAYEMTVPLVVEYKIAENWREAH
jgi:DNA polymerase-1